MHLEQFDLHGRHEPLGHSHQTLQLIHAWDIGDHFAAQIELHINAPIVVEPTGSGNAAAEARWKRC